MYKLNKKNLNKFNNQKIQIFLCNSEITISDQSLHTYIKYNYKNVKCNKILYKYMYGQKEIEDITNIIKDTNIQYDLSKTRQYIIANIIGPCTGN
jgi:hypothetical protein